MRKCNILSVSIIMSIIFLLGCDQQNTASVQNIKSTKSAATRIDPGDWSVDFRYNDWGGGFACGVVVTNHSDTAIENWQLSFDWDHQIIQSWGAEMVNNDSNHYVFKGSSWNKDILPEQSVFFGFTGTPGNIQQDPWNIVLSEAYSEILPQPIIEYRDALQSQMHKGYLVKAKGTGFMIDPPQYQITIYQDPTFSHWPDWYSLLVKADIYVSYIRDAADPVRYDYTLAEYQIFSTFDIVMNDMLIEGLRQITQEEQITTKTLGLLDDIVITEYSENRIRFRRNDLKWKIIKHKNGNIQTVQQEYLATPEKFYKSLVDLVPEYHVTMTEIQTFVPPSGYKVTVGSMMDCGGDTDCYFPGMLGLLELNGFESFGGAWDIEPEIDIYKDSLQAYYYDITAPPDGDLLYYGTYLLLQKSGIKTIYNYMIIAEMTKIRVREVIAEDAITIIDSQDRIWSIQRIDGEVILEQLYINQ